MLRIEIGPVWRFHKDGHPQSVVVMLGVVSEIRKTGKITSAGPHQLLADGGQPRALAALGLDQRHAEKCGPLLDQIPDVAIGEVGVAGAGLSAGRDRIGAYGARLSRPAGCRSVDAR